MTNSVSRLVYSTLSRRSRIHWIGRSDSTASRLSLMGHCSRRHRTGFSEGPICQTWPLSRAGTKSQLWSPFSGRVATRAATSLSRIDSSKSGDTRVSSSAWTTQSICRARSEGILRLRSIDQFDKPNQR